MKHLLLLLIVLSGCANAYRISYVNQGMTKAEVIEMIGRPSSVSVSGNVEYLIYKMHETNDDAIYGHTRDYYVRLTNGKVDSYGRVGDFDSTKNPAIEVKKTVEETRKVESDNVEQLRLLRDLYDEGLISDQEYEEKRKEILDRL